MPRHARPIVCKALLAALWIAITAPCMAGEKPLPPGREHSFKGKEEERARKIQREFQDAGRELAETHAEALRKPELTGPLESLRSAMEAEMLRLAPDQKEAILRRYVVHREMTQLEKIEHPTVSQKERFKALLLDFTNLTEALGDLPDQAAQAPRVLEEREKFHKVLLAVMTKINPKVPELMQQQKKSIADYSELEQELLRKHTAPKPPAK